MKHIQLLSKSLKVILVCYLFMMKLIYADVISQCPDEFERLTKKVSSDGGAHLWNFKDIQAGLHSGNSDACFVKMANYAIDNATNAWVSRFNDNGCNDPKASKKLCDSGWTTPMPNLEYLKFLSSTFQLELGKNRDHIFRCVGLSSPTQGEALALMRDVAGATPSPSSMEVRLDMDKEMKFECLSQERLTCKDRVNIAWLNSLIKQGIDENNPRFQEVLKKIPDRIIKAWQTDMLNNAIGHARKVSKVDEIKRRQTAERAKSEQARLPKTTLGEALGAEIADEFEALKDTSAEMIYLLDKQADKYAMDEDDSWLEWGMAGVRNVASAGRFVLGEFVDGSEPENIDCSTAYKVFHYHKKDQQPPSELQGKVPRVTYQWCAYKKYLNARKSLAAATKGFISKQKDKLDSKHPDYEDDIEKLDKIEKFVTHPPKKRKRDLKKDCDTEFTPETYMDQVDTQFLCYAKKAHDRNLDGLFGTGVGVVGAAAAVPALAAVIPAAAGLLSSTAASLSASAAGGSLMAASAISAATGAVAGCKAALLGQGATLFVADEIRQSVADSSGLENIKCDARKKAEDHLSLETLGGLLESCAYAGTGGAVVGATAPVSTVLAVGLGTVVGLGCVGDSVSTHMVGYKPGVCAADHIKAGITGQAVQTGADTPGASLPEIRDSLAESARSKDWGPFCETGQGRDGFLQAIVCDSNLQAEQDMSGIPEDMKSCIDYIKTERLIDKGTALALDVVDAVGTMYGGFKALRSTSRGGTSGPDPSNNASAAPPAPEIPTQLKRSKTVAPRESRAPASTTVGIRPRGDSQASRSGNGHSIDADDDEQGVEDEDIGF
jgi:hypothetical protein